ncbi:unnamed protein product, partial [Trifolium pratense]
IAPITLDSKSTIRSPNFSNDKSFLFTIPITHLFQSLQIPKSPSLHHSVSGKIHFSFIRSFSRSVSNNEASLSLLRCGVPVSAIPPPPELSLTSTRSSPLAVDYHHSAAISLEEAAVFKAIWKYPAPSKVSALLLKLQHDRIPTKVNLYRRRTAIKLVLFVKTVLKLRFIYCCIAIFQSVFGAVCLIGICLWFPHNFLSLFNSYVCVAG